MGALLLPFSIMLVFYLTTRPQIKPLPKYHPLEVSDIQDTIYHQIPSVAAQTLDGDTLRIGGAGQNAWMGHFFPYPCHDTCQAMLERLAEVAGAIKPGAPLQLYSIAVGQDRYGGISLEEIDQSYPRKPDRWKILQMPDEQALEWARSGFLWEVRNMAQLIMDRRYAYQLVLVDQQGVIRGQYNILDDQDLKKLRDEAVVLIQYSASS